MYVESYTINAWATPKFAKSYMSVLKNDKPLCAFFDMKNGEF